MSITVTPTNSTPTGDFSAEISGIDLSQPLTPADRDAIEAAINAGESAKVPGLMTDAWLADNCLFGTATQVRDGIEAWFDAGVSTPIVVPSSTSGGQAKAVAELFAAYE